MYRSDGSPGPGSYEIKTNKGRGPRWGYFIIFFPFVNFFFFSFGSEKRSKPMNRSVEPGPGAYNIPPKFANLPKYALTGSLKV